MEFYETEAGQFIVGAHRYISASRVVRYSTDFDDRSRFFLTPVLHLLGHGMELLFKYPFLRGGASQAEVLRKFGHNLEELWAADENRILRCCAESLCKEVWRDAAESGRWPNDDFSLDPVEVLVKAVHDMGYLHGPQSSYALRYTLPSRSTLAPRPAFLIDVFSVISDRSVEDPSYLEKLPVD